MTVIRVDFVGYFGHRMFLKQILNMFVTVVLIVNLKEMKTAKEIFARGFV